ncbi:hypothetical protein V8E36_001301 [Tilletia maclaganii]
MKIARLAATSALLALCLWSTSSFAHPVPGGENLMQANTQALVKVPSRPQNEVDITRRGFLSFLTKNKMLTLIAVGILGYLESALNRRDMSASHRGLDGPASATSSEAVVPALPRKFNEVHIGRRGILSWLSKNKKFTMIMAGLAGIVMELFNHHDEPKQRRAYNEAVLLQMANQPSRPHTYQPIGCEPSKPVGREQPPSLPEEAGTGPIFHPCNSSEPIDGPAHPHHPREEHTATHDDGAAAPAVQKRGAFWDLVNAGGIMFAVGEVGTALLEKLFHALSHS